MTQKRKGKGKGKHNCFRTRKNRKRTRKHQQLQQQRGNGLKRFSQSAMNLGKQAVAKKWVDVANSVKKAYNHPNVQKAIGLYGEATTRPEEFYLHRKPGADFREHASKYSAKPPDAEWLQAKRNVFRDQMRGKDVDKMMFGPRKKKSSSNSSDSRSNSRSNSRKKKKSNNAAAHGLTVGVEKKYGPRVLNNAIVQIDFIKMLTNCVRKEIRDEQLQKAVIHYNHVTQTPLAEIPWDSLSATTGVSVFSLWKDQIVSTTARGVAIAKTMVVQSSFVQTGKYLVDVVPLGVQTGWGLLDWGLMESIIAMVCMVYTNPDYSIQQNTDIYNRHLTNTLHVILSQLLQGMTNQGCSNAIPKILQRIIHPTRVFEMARLLKEERLVDENVGMIADNSDEFCNKIIPAVSKHFKQHGFSQGVGEEATHLLSDYLQSSTKLVKDILWNVVKRNLADMIDRSSQLRYLDDDIVSGMEMSEYHMQFNDIFQTSSISAAVKQFEKISQEAYSEVKDVTLPKSAIITSVTSIAPLPPAISSEEEELKRLILAYVGDKVTIGDFMTNLFPSVEKLLVLWNREMIRLHAITEVNECLMIDALLNVVDLRINTLLTEACTIYAPQFMSEHVCAPKFVALVETFYTTSSTTAANAAAANAVAAAAATSRPTIKSVVADVLIVVLIKTIKENAIQVSSNFVKKNGTFSKLFVMFDKMLQSGGMEKRVTKKRTTKSLVKAKKADQPNADIQH